MFVNMRITCFVLTLVVGINCRPSPQSSPLRLARRSINDANAYLDSTNNEFDYVIIGGGNAGLTLAARLSEDLTTRVAVVEAGGFYEDSVGNGSQLSIPAEDILWAGKNVTDTNPNVDWGFTTVPQAVSQLPSGLRVHC